MEYNNKEVIDIGKILKLLWNKKKLFFIVWVATFFLSCLWILPKPRYYSASVTLAPEFAGESMAGGLSSIASTFGISLDGSSADAIYPLLYPDLIASNDFLVSLLDIPVKSADGEIDCNLYTYIDKKQKVAFYEIPVMAFKRWIGATFGEKEQSISVGGKGNSNGINPFCMTKRQTSLIDLLRNKITCSVDKKTQVFSIGVSMQDRLIAATLADSVTARLQKFITEYKTSKARNDLDYYTKLVNEAKADYEKARKAYASFADANTELSMPSYNVKLEDMENDMQLKFNTYTAMTTQMEGAKAKVQERTPSFTVLQSPTVPVKASSPKRMIFCIGMLFLATCGTIVYLLIKEKQKEDNNQANA